LRAKYGDASVKYTNFMFGELDSTYTAETSAKLDALLQAGTQLQPAARQPAEPQPAQPEPQPAQATPASGLGAAFSQCGGKSWMGSTTCQPGCTCVASGEHYSQCTPPAGAWTCEMAVVAAARQLAEPQPAQPEPQPAQATPAPSLGAAFSQCGGKSWRGSTTCQPGCTCVASGKHYSQCIPPTGASTCGMAAVDASDPRKHSHSRQRRLRARRENVLLQRLGALTRDAAVDRSNRESQVLAGDEL